MKPIADVVNAISGVINGVTLPAREKKELQAEILRLVYEREREMIEARAGRDNEPRLPEIGYSVRGGHW